MNFNSKFFNSTPQTAREFRVLLPLEALGRQLGCPPKLSYNPAWDASARTEVLGLTQLYEPSGKSLIRRGERLDPG